MATADTVKAQLRSLIDSANAKTGKADQDLTTAVSSLAAGYGLGSDPVLTELTITENGEYTPGEGVDGFSRVVANVAGSGVDYFQFATNLNSILKNAENVPETVEITAPNAKDFTYAFSSAAGLKHLIINVDAPTVVSYMCNSQYLSADDRVLETVTINGDLSGVTQTYQAFYESKKLREVNAMWYFTSMQGSYRPFRGCTALEEARFKENYVSTGPFSFAESANLSNATLISVANALNTGASDKTLTLGTTPKARCDEILGVVSTVTDGDASYDFFTMDEAGTVTLTEFITTVKGWTLA